jgi:hypothetical protein
MSVIYVVEEASAATGPWTAVLGSPFTTTSDVVSGLSASTAYYFRITAKDTVLGISSTPTVVGPVVTSASGAIESAQNSRISSSAATAVPPVGAITATNSGSAMIGVSLSSTMISSGLPSGTVVGQISVSTTGGAFSGSLSLGGANASSFAISGSNLVTAAVLSAGTYQITITATQAGAIGSPFTTSFSISTTPAQAAAVGYNTLTFGPSIVPLGTALRPFSFFGTVPVTPTQNPDGSLTLTTQSNGFGADLCTASFVNGATTWQNFSGVAFGGGCYAEAVMSQTGGNTNPGMSFWLNDIESMNGGSAGDLTGRHWPGQSADYGNWIEVDIAEFDAAGDSYGCGDHNWYGTASVFGDANTGSYPGFVSPVTPGTGIDWSKPHRYGWLWVPATGSAPAPTNILPNSSETGVAVGTPGTMPTGWDRSRIAGLSSQIVSIGSSGGFPYFDFRLFGTADGSDVHIWFCPINGFPAPASTSYSQTVSLAVVAGSAPANMYLDTDNLDSSGNYLGSAGLTGITLTGTLATYTNSVASSSSAARLNPQFGFFGPAAGTAVDVTFRISNPQLLEFSSGSGTQGYQKFYFDGVQVGTTLFWDQWSSSNPPPPVQGSSAYSVLDTRHVAFIFGIGNPARPVTVYSLSVWQASSANNLVK